ncbi:glycosyltransferase family 4 protein [Candidatus Entotheonella palauensis]|uniref:glycosyltransferase family 4 protein n=1 Tax=Candidatus Entotheonella palauensis TaxID=93172 RepID=UPI0015C44C85|nr:glycosyltransferase family 4 protein [Candidatus Entotheonella palauensis]
MTQLRLLFFLNSGVRGGIEEHVLSLLQHLPRDHFRFALACPPELIEAMTGDLTDLPVTVFPVRATGWTQWREMLHLQHIVQQFQPHIVHCHLFRATLVGAPIAWAMRVPVIVETYHGREAWRQGQSLKGQFVIDRLVAGCVNHIIAVSEAAARFLIEHKRIPAHKITVIPNGRDLRAFQPGRRAGSAIRKRFQIPASAPVLGVVGRLEPQKGHQYLLQALPQICASFPDARLLLVGEGSLHSALQNQAKDLGLHDNVIFAQFQSDIPAFLDAMDIVVLPSLHEGLSLTAIEASAMAKPIVATDVDGTPEVVRDGTTGVLVPPAAPDDLAHAVLTLLQHPDLAFRYGAAAHAWARQHFDLQRQIDETEWLYLELIAMQ